VLLIFCYKLTGTNRTLTVRYLMGSMCTVGAELSGKAYTSGGAKFSFPSPLFVNVFENDYKFLRFNKVLEK